MDCFTKHWGASPRRFPAASALQSMGDIRGKNGWVRHTFDTCNFSVILRGRGQYWREGKLWRVEAPCVITQWPGEPLAYGPELPETWDEIYLIYGASCREEFRRRGIVDESRPTWPIRNLDAVMPHVDELRALAGSRGSEASADRVDRVAERLILETLLPGVKAGADTGDEIVQNIILQMRSRPRETHDFARLARTHGISPSTLRRRWHEALKTTPGRYLLDQRIRRARRLLAETSLQVGEIAAETGFQDMLYFSRRFKLETNLTPSQYRKHYRIKTGGGYGPLKATGQR